LREYINRKEITSSSFAFTIENDVWEDYDTETKKRTILKIHRLYDVSPVFNPAYTDTSVGKRSLDEYIKAEQRKLDEAKETREKELEKYFVQLEQRYNKLTNKQNN
jgi:phage head maturation protease